MKSFVMTCVLVLVLLVSTNLESPAYPNIDNCTAAVIGLCQAQYLLDLCQQQVLQSCAMYQVAVLQGVGLVAHYCNFDG